jgi:hypothetical protein
LFGERRAVGVARRDVSAVMPGMPGIGAGFFPGGGLTGFC